MDPVTRGLLGHKWGQGERGVQGSVLPVLCKSLGERAKERGGAYLSCVALLPLFLCAEAGWHQPYMWKATRHVSSRAAPRGGTLGHVALGAGEHTPNAPL